MNGEMGVDDVILKTTCLYRYNEQRAELSREISTIIHRLRVSRRRVRKWCAATLTSMGGHSSGVTSS